MAVCSETYMALCDEVQKLRQQLEQAKARAGLVRYLADRMLEAIQANDHALTGAEQDKADEMLFSSTEDYLIAIEDGLPSDAWLLRKQAEAVEAFLSELREVQTKQEKDFGVAVSYSLVSQKRLDDYAQRLRQQADKLEKQE